MDAELETRLDKFARMDTAHRAAIVLMAANLPLTYVNAIGALVAMLGRENVTEKMGENIADDILRIAEARDRLLSMKGTEPRSGG